MLQLCVMNWDIQEMVNYNYGDVILTLYVVSQVLLVLLIHVMVNPTKQFI